MYNGPGQTVKHGSTLEKSYSDFYYTAFLCDAQLFSASFFLSKEKSKEALDSSRLTNPAFLRRKRGSLNH
jgi:hypothetical protein